MRDSEITIYTDGAHAILPILELLVPQHHHWINP